MLDGEAEFHVTHTIDNQRFIVKTSSDFEVEVFGTKFVLYARQQAKKVVLNEGKVQVNYQGGKKQLMKPGDVVTLTTGAQNSGPGQNGRHQKIQRLEGSPILL